MAAFCSLPLEDLSSDEVIILRQLSENAASNTFCNVENGDSVWKMHAVGELADSGGRNSRYRRIAPVKINEYPCKGHFFQQWKAWEKNRDRPCLPAMKLADSLAARWPGLRLEFRRALGLEIERHSSADEILQGFLIDLVAFVDVDGAPYVGVEAGVE
jgi:hypothetical protein